MKTRVMLGLLLLVGLSLFAIEKLTLEDLQKTQLMYVEADRTILPAEEKLPLVKQSEHVFSSSASNRTYKKAPIQDYFPRFFDTLFDKSDADESRRVALEILTKATTNATINGQVAASTAFQKVQDGLKQSTLSWPRDGYDFTKCTNTQEQGLTLAYVMDDRENKIYLCATLKHRTNPFIAQTLIHQTAHLLGYHDECDATMVEVGAMRWSHQGLVYRHNLCEVGFKSKTKEKAPLDG